MCSYIVSCKFTSISSEPADSVFTMKESMQKFTDFAMEHVSAIFQVKSSTLRMEAAGSPGTSVNLYQTTWHHITEYITFNPDLQDSGAGICTETSQIKNTLVWKCTCRLQVYFESRNRKTGRPRTRWESQVRKVFGKNGQKI